MRQDFVRFLVTMARHPSSSGKKLAWLGVGAFTFLLVSPWLLGMGGYAIVQALAPFARTLELTVGALAFVAGFALLAWILILQWHQGGGTPVPAAPTQHLITTGPYAFCRHPMYLGAAIYHLGFVTLFFGFLPGLGVSVAVLAFAILYGRNVEERELEARFGEEYRAYRARTPFLFPRRKGPRSGAF